MEELPFIVGREYSRRDIYAILGVPTERQKGIWHSGYARWGDHLFIFCNVGATGRTGHDYDNRWLNETQFQWYAKEGTHTGQKLIQWMIKPSGKVLLFMRQDNLNPFTFQGFAEVETYEESSPVRFVWNVRRIAIVNGDLRTSCDLAAPIASRVESIVRRIIRDTALSRELKSLHEHRCQVCGHRIELGGDEYYSEAHHIRPLGCPHDGPDIRENIIVVCPNHHVLCDYGAISLSLASLREHPHHQVDQVFVDYHNQNIFQGQPNLSCLDSAS